MSSSNKPSSQNHKHAANGHKSNIQYVAKVRYSNNLPPPACPPKLLKDNKTDLDAGVKSIVSSFFRKENFKNLIKLNEDLGMQMNLVSLPDKETIYGVTNDNSPLILHPSDQLLLADPTKHIQTKSDSVGFLRRTQYISSDIQSSANSASTATVKLPNIKPQRENEFDPKSQLKTIEDMFDASSVDLSTIKHPTKKHLKAKKIWNFLPDTSMLDQKFYDIRFGSSASISKNTDKSKDAIKSINDPRLLTSILKEIELNKTTKLVSFYLTDEFNAINVKEKLEDETENAPIDDDELEEATNDESKKVLYKKQREYDCSEKPVDPLRQLVIKFDEKTNKAYYVPISSRMELKKCRIDPYLLPKIKEVSYDEIDLIIREPTRSEIENRDILRSNFDPMEFGADE